MEIRIGKKLPKRVSSSDPVPELEHVLGVDAELDDLGAVGRQSDEVLGHRRFLIRLKHH